MGGQPVTDVPVLIQRLDVDLGLPDYAHAGDAGLDLVARVAVRIEPGERSLVPTGIAIAMPDGYAAFVHPRSGLAIKKGITVVNAPGTIDAGYRGEIAVALVNLDPLEAVEIQRGDRIAQLIFQEVAKIRWIQVDHLPGSDRGQGGFGSTGR
jgi:dUTP pyrophosphatase